MHFTEGNMVSRISYGNSSLVASNDNLPDATKGKGKESSAIGSRRVTLAPAELAHFQERGHEVAYLFENKKSPGVGEFRRIEKAVITEGTVSSQIVEKASGDQEGERYILKFIHNVPFTTRIKRHLQRLVFMVVSRVLWAFRDNAGAAFYELKSRYYDNIAILYYRERFANNVWHLLLGNNNNSPFSSEVFYEAQSLKDGSIDSLLPALAIKYFDRCEPFEKCALLQKMEGRSPDDFFTGRYHPAFIHYLRILVQLDEDALKLDNYLLQPVPDEGTTHDKPRYRCLPVDGGMCMYKSGHGFRKARTVDKLLAKLRGSSLKHYTQYACRPTMLSVLEKMEKKQPGYLRQSLVDALECIASVDIDRLINCAADMDMDADKNPEAHREFERIKTLLEKQHALAKRLVEGEHEYQNASAKPVDDTDGKNLLVDNG